ncbi:MAG: DUF1844 domain-containing protein [Candidatus Eremiobacteraeota bacterium]|nr:DUF1844 domain-containing protein [Candidatus Eremiobacteraeota bacterium]
MDPDAKGRGSPTQSEAPHGPPPVRVLAFTILSLLADAAAAHLGTPLPGTDAGSSNSESGGDLHEARLAIDVANAVLGAARTALQSDERLAIEGLLTQLQVEYVRRWGSP